MERRARCPTIRQEIVHDREHADMKRPLALICASVLLVMGCAPVEQQGEVLYAIPHLGETYPVTVSYPDGLTLSQARANGQAVYKVVHPKRAMTCDGSELDCRRTVADLVDRVEALGNGSD